MSGTDEDRQYAAVDRTDRDRCVCSGGTLYRWGECDLGILFRGKRADARGHRRAGVCSCKEDHIFPAAMDAAGSGLRREGGRVPRICIIFHG